MAATAAAPLLGLSASLCVKAATTLGVFFVALRKHRQNHHHLRQKQRQQQGSDKTATAAEEEHIHTPPILAGPRPCMGDLSVTETVVNLVTCAPYFNMAWRVTKQGLAKLSVWNRLFSVSCSFTGLCALAYHLSSGPVRNFFRRLDYTAVALSAVSLTCARARPRPLFACAISAVLAPFQPLLVAAAHVFGTEIAFMRKALADPKLRDTHFVHTLAGVGAFTAFYADDWFPQVPYLHASWHILSAYATSLTPCLIPVD